MGIDKEYRGRMVYLSTCFLLLYADQPCRLLFHCTMSGVPAALSAACGYNCLTPKTRANKVFKEHVGIHPHAGASGSRSREDLKPSSAQDQDPYDSLTSCHSV